MKTVLVTGSAGFIGYHTAERYLAEGWRVIGLDAFTEYYDPQLKRDRAARLAQHENYVEVEDRVEGEGVERAQLRHHTGELAHGVQRSEVQRVDVHPPAQLMGQPRWRAGSGDDRVALLEKRQRTIDSISPFQADSLDQVTSRIAQIRAEQESRMAALTTRSHDQNYLDTARVQVDAEARGTETYDVGIDQYEDLGLITDKIEIGANHVQTPQTN